MFFCSIEIVDYYYFFIIMNSTQLNSRNPFPTYMVLMVCSATPNYRGEGIFLALFRWWVIVWLARLSYVGLSIKDLKKDYLDYFWIFSWLSFCSFAQLNCGRGFSFMIMNSTEYNSIQLNSTKPFPTFTIMICGVRAFAFKLSNSQLPPTSLKLRRRYLRSFLQTMGYCPNV